MTKNIDLRIPSLSQIPEKGIPSKNSIDNKIAPSEFDKILNVDEFDVKISKHAEKRMLERNIDLDSDEFLKIKDGISKLKEKGGKDSLLITNKGAYIVDVENRTLVTAIDKEDMGSNVFTKIDSTIFMN